MKYFLLGKKNQSQKTTLKNIVLIHLTIIFSKIIVKDKRRFDSTDRPSDFRKTLICLTDVWLPAGIKPKKYLILSKEKVFGSTLYVQVKAFSEASPRFSLNLVQFCPKRFSIILTLAWAVKRRCEMLLDIKHLFWP